MEEKKTPEEIHKEALQTWPKEMTHPIAIASGDGLLYAIKAFFEHNEIEPTPGTLSETPGKDFILGLMAEYKPHELDLGNELKSVPYPLTKSFKTHWSTALTELTPILVALWLNGEQDQAVRLTRTVAFGEALKFFEANRQEIIDAIAKLRGDDLPTDFSKPPHG